MDNYPPGVSDSTYGAPWNDIDEKREVTITLKACISVSFQGPARISEYEILQSIKDVVEEDLKKTVEDYEVVSVDLTDKTKKPYRAAVWWSVEDFAGMAEQQFELMTCYSDNSPESVQERAKRILSTCKDWKDYYDESKFEEALDQMIHKHDAEYGITWESIKFWLNELCVKSEIEEEE